MNKFLKKALAMLLAVMMCVGMVTTTAFAAEETCEHKLVGGTISYDAGKVRHYCRVCGHVWWISTGECSADMYCVDTGNHQYDVPATCTTGATCKWCGAAKDNQTDPSNHVDDAAKYFVDSTDCTKHYQKWECCGAVVPNSTVDHGTTNFVNGVCKLCNYTCNHTDKDGESTKGSYGKTDDNTHNWTCTVCGTKGEDNHSMFTPNAQQIAELAELCEHQTKTFQYQCTDCKALLNSEQKGTKSFTKVYAEPTDPNSDHTSHSWTCSNACGETGTDSCDPLKWENDDKTTDTDGKCAMGDIPQTATCAVCNAVVHRTVKGTGEHHLEKHEAKAATCTEDGNTEYWQCTICQTLFSDEAGEKATAKEDVTIPATGHSMTAHEANDATCTEDGNVDYWTCSVCTKLFSDEEGKTVTTEEAVVIPAHHTMKSEPVPAKAATCLAEGNLEYYECEKCDVKFKDAEGKEAYAKDGEVLAIDASNHVSNETTWVNTNETEHWKTYDCCKAEVERTRAAHAYSWTSDGNNGYNGVCECGATAHSDGAPEHVCVFDGPWLSANGKHFHECTVYPECHEKQGEADHNFGAYVTVSDTLRVSTCADCGATRTVTSRPSTDPGTPITPAEPVPGPGEEDEGLTDIEDETTPLAGLPFDLAPTDELTRGLFAEILYWYEGEPEPDGEAPFTDVEGHEYAQAITWGAVNGVLLGYDDDTYRPDNAITRGEMESILKRYVQYKQSKVVVDLSGDDTDVMLWLEAEEIIDNFFAALAIEAE